MSFNQQTCESVAELDQSLRRNGNLRPDHSVDHTVFFLAGAEQGYIWQNLRPGLQINFFFRTEQGYIDCLGAKGLESYLGPPRVIVWDTLRNLSSTKWTIERSMGVKSGRIDLKHLPLEFSFRSM